MRILALETTEATGSVAAMANDKLLLELTLEPSVRSARSLAPGMKDLLRQVGWRAADVDLVAATVGPGSFTGLRVGVTAAKTFAYAAQAEVLGLNTLEVIAAGAPAEVELLSAAVDAQRGDVAAGLFRRRPDGWFEPVRQESFQLMPAALWLAGLPAGAWLSGPALKRLAVRTPETLRVVAPEFWSPRASNVARLAARHYACGRRDDVWKLLPHYARRSAAEEKWDAAGT